MLKIRLKCLLILYDDHSKDNFHCFLHKEAYSSQYASNFAIKLLMHIPEWDFKRKKMN